MIGMPAAAIGARLSIGFPLKCSIPASVRFHSFNRSFHKAAFFLPGQLNTSQTGASTYMQATFSVFWAAQLKTNKPPRLNPSSVTFRKDYKDPSYSHRIRCPEKLPLDFHIDELHRNKQCGTLFPVTLCPHLEKHRRTPDARSTDFLWLLFRYDNGCLAILEGEIVAVASVPFACFSWAWATRPVIRARSTK